MFQSSGLQDIQKELDVICSEGRILSFIRGSKRHGRLVKLKESLSDTANTFVVSSVATIQIQIGRVVRAVYLM